MLAAGFISKLCDTLELTAQHGLLAAYTYALLDGNNPDSLAIAVILFDARTAPQTSIEFEQGRTMAVKMLDQLKESGYATAADHHFGRREARFAC